MMNNKIGRLDHIIQQAEKEQESLKQDYNKIITERDTLGT